MAAILPRHIGLPPGLRPSPSALYLESLPLSLESYSADKAILRRLADMSAADHFLIVRDFVRRYVVATLRRWLASLTLW